MNNCGKAVLGIAMIFSFSGCESDFERCVKTEADIAAKRMTDELGDNLALELLRLRIFYHQEEAISIQSSRYSEVLQSDTELREALGVSSAEEAIRAFEFREWTEIMLGEGVTPQSWDDVEAYRDGMAKSFERLVLPWTEIKLTPAEVRENSDRRLKALEKAEEAYYSEVAQIASKALGLAQNICERKR